MRRGRGPLAGALILVALVLAGCSDGGDGGPQLATVPELRGVRPDLAVQRVCAAGLRIGDIRSAGRRPPLGRLAGRDPDRRLATILRASEIVASRPAAGARVAAESPVVLELATPRDAVLALHTECP